MSKFATKAAANMFCQARYEAAKSNERLSSREGAAEEIGIDRTRLARIELGSTIPYQEEVLLMADCYKAPELKGNYCREMCPLGKNMPKIENAGLDRISLRMLSSLKKINEAKESEIREKCAEYTVPHLKDQGEAWGEVQKAISQYGYYRQEEALESLTPIVREAVKRLGFREICLDENQDAVRAHFFKIYSSLIERKTNDAKLPPSILEAKNKYIAQLTTQENVAIEQQHREQIAEEPERATPEYIDMLMREHGFKR